jgi:hypothetical protein
LFLEGNINTEYKAKADPNLSENRIKLRSNIINESYFSSDKLEPEVKYKTQRVPTSYVYLKPFATKTK